MRSLLYPWRRYQLWRLGGQLEKAIEDEVAEEFLELLLNLIKIYILADVRWFRRLLHRLMPDKVLYYGLQDRVAHFNGALLFESQDQAIRVLATFSNGKLHVEELAPGEPLASKPNVRILFKDSKALMNFLLPKGELDGRRDILNSILNNEIILDGNFNYMYRFGFLATHIQLELAGQLP